MAPGGSVHTRVTFREGERPVVSASAMPSCPLGTLMITVSCWPCFSGPPPPNPAFWFGPGMITEPARLTRPHPDEGLGDTPASEGLYCPVNSTAPLISNAFMRAAAGCGVPFLTRVSRKTAAQPATRGVAMLVPVSKKNAGSDETPKNAGGAATAARERVDKIDVPGATTSGLIRPSLVRPRLLKAAMPSASLAKRSL